MSRVWSELEPGEVSAVQELSALPNSRLVYKDNTGAVTGLTVGTNLTVSGGALNATGGSGSGDVVGPSGATSDDIATFDGATGKLIKDSGTKVADLVPKSLYDAHTVLYATTDNTPAALTVTEQTVVGRATGGNITALAIDSDLTSVSANDDTIPSAKATKTALDLKALKDGSNWTFSSQAAGDIAYASSATAYTRLAKGSDGQVLTLASGVPSWATATGGASFWTAVAGSPTRASNTTFTVTGDYTSLFAKGMILKWTESSTVRYGMVSIPSTYGAPNTTVTIIGNSMASIDSSSLKYAMIGAEAFIANFAVAGAIGATGTDVANAYYAKEPMVVLGADLQVGTAGTTNSTTIDINKGGTTMFTTKPTLATTVATSPTPFTADTATTLALADKVTIDIDAVQTTPAVDLYVQLYLFPTRYANL